MTQATEVTESQPTAASSMEEVDVAILGAGPAGLSTALGLHKACPDLKARSTSHVATCAMLQHAHLEGTIKHLIGKEQESMFAKVITKCLYARIKWDQMRLVLKPHGSRVIGFPSLKWCGSCVGACV
jgi:hypothetical protein